MFPIRPDRSWSLHGIAASRELERLAQAGLPAHTLMQRAGHSVARLARALAPHGRKAWLACGPGNNGGDGFEAALGLRRQGWEVTLTWTSTEHSPVDAQMARERALAAGLSVSASVPQTWDIAIDALLGLGGDLSPARAASAQMQSWLAHMHGRDGPVLAVDLPTGLQAETGRAEAPAQGLSRRHTLSLLTLKPGLFTGEGRDLSGQVWFDPLGVDTSQIEATAWLLGSDRAGVPTKAGAPHASHKGRFGDVVVVGGQQRAGAASMVGAALLAARAALHAGAGRVYVTPLADVDLSLDLVQPELMFRSASGLAALLGRQEAVVAGCGGGEAIAEHLPELLDRSAKLVLDADALNALAHDHRLRAALTHRSQRGLPTVLTPHPLEAARLLGTHTEQVQAHRLQAAQALSAEFGCVVVLKGSGTVVSAPGRRPHINATGNALLASPGTGDVLAGMVGAALARGEDAETAALQSVHEHGRRADAWAAASTGRLLTASALAKGGASD